MKLTEIPIGDDAPKLVHAVIEIPKASKNKFEYNAEWEAFFLDRILAGPLRYPAAYGFIPQTHGLDGDTMDILVVQDEPAITGCIVEARPLGVLRLFRPDGGDVDEKIVAVSANDPMYRDARKFEDLPEYLCEELDYFFRHLKEPAKDKLYETEWDDAKKARAMIRKRHAAYRKHQK